MKHFAENAANLKKIEHIPSNIVHMATNTSASFSFLVNFSGTIVHQAANRWPH